MISRILQIVLGVMFFFCSTPQGMANTAISEEVRADFFDGFALNDEDGKQKAVAFNDMALVQFAEAEADSENSVDSEEEAKREQKRTASHKITINNCRNFNFLSPRVQAEGAARLSLAVDARQERTAAIRFLQIQALAC